MTEAVKDLSVRAFCLGCVIFLAMLPLGKKAFSEPVRIACAALAILFVFSLFRKKLPEIRFDRYKPVIESAVNVAIAQNEADRLTSAEKAVGEYAQRLAGAIDAGCELKITLTTEDGVFSVETVYVSGFSHEKREKLSQVLIEALAPSKIVFGEIE